jgi:hypothetical protein
MNEKCLARLRTLFTAFTALAIASILSAGPKLTPRNLLAGPPELHQLGKDIPGIQAALLPHGDWEPFPRAADRASWEAIDPATRDRLIAEGEAVMAEPWPMLRATLFLDYMREGDRRSYQNPWTERRNRLRALVLAECAEGEGRFLDEITDGLWLHFEESTWAYPAHIFMQRAGSDLPDATEPIVDLGVGETAALISWIDYLLGPELDSVSKVTRQRLHHEIQTRILEPCLHRADFWWMAWDTQGHPINNWNPWIVANWLSSALLIETDPELRARHVEKAQRVLDIFINSYPADGGCDEGPSYWGRAGASMFEALDWIDGASEGRISIFDEALIAKMGRYILTAHVGNGWYKNFADANARTFVDGALTYRYGQAVGDDELAAFGAYLWQRQQGSPPPNLGSIGRDLPNIFLAAELSAATAEDPLPRDGWLPDLQIMTARDTAGTTDGLYVTAKGGHNDESHNHNDVGSFIAFLDGLPLILDVGPEIYTAKTFSDQRYEIWTMRSSWHNVPSINGYEQAPGRSFTAHDVAYTADADHATLSLNLEQTYPVAAGIESWRRAVTLHRGEHLEIVDDYALNAVTAPITLHFVTNRPIEVRNGRVHLGAFPGHPASRGATIPFEAAAYDVRIVDYEITDTRLRGIWGPRMHRIDFVAKSTDREGQTRIEIHPADS